MTIDCIEFNANDVALAIANEIERESNDLPYESQTQMTRDISAITSKARQRCLKVAKLHNVNDIGEADDGNEDRAKAFLEEVQKFEADPTSYLKSLNAIDSDDEEEDAPGDSDGPVAQPAAVPQPQPVAALVVPQGEAAPPAAEPVDIEPLKYMRRVASDVFPVITGSYQSEMVDVPKWAKAKKPAVAEPDPHYCFDSFKIKVLASAMRRNKNVMAVGDPGCGKTEFFKQFARRIGMPYNGITFDGQLSRAEIIGSFRQITTPTGSATPFVDGLIPKLIQQPGILCLNEIDQCDPDIQYMLHDVYEGGGLTIQEDGGRFIPRHPDCFIVATANTKGRGSDNGLTNAKFEMSEATRDRYPIWLNFTYLEPAKESETIVAKTSINEDVSAKLVEIATSIRSAWKNGEMSQPCSLRQLLDVAEMAEDFNDRGPYEALAIAADLVLVGRANEEDATAIREFINQHVGIDLTTLVF